MIKTIIAAFLLSSLAFAQADFKPASSCGECHDEIYQQWRTSMHASAALEKDPLFAGMYSWANQDGGDKLTEKCQDCHSPMSLVFQSTERGAIYNEEGVTCQFCHGAEKINGFRSAQDFQINLSAIYGATTDTANAAHPVEFREFFKTSEICLPCHAEMKNLRGVKVCATGSEWKAYYKKTQKNCQDCHMPAKAGRASHNFAGTHRGNLLQKAVDMQLSFSRAEKELVIRLTNSGAGHAIPTGTPLRMVILKVTGLNANGKKIWENWKENPMTEDRTGLFMKILGDAQGNGPVPPWKATQVIYDRRLMPGSPEIIRYQIQNENVRRVQVALIYRFAPYPVLQKFNISDPQYTQPKLLIHKEIEM